MYVLKRITNRSFFYSSGRLIFVFLLCISLCVPVALFSQTTPLTFTPIPYSDPDIISPGRGAEQWDFGSEKINYPTADTNIRPLDVYYRFPWTILEGDSINSYDWTFFDDVMHQTIDHRQKLSFGIMPVYDGRQTVQYDGAISAYPLYLHQLMQSGTWNTKDWISNGVWIPNWNSTHYLTRLRALHEALYKHIMSTSYKGVAFKDAIYCIDIRGYGNYGEWHNAGIIEKMSEYPVGRRATAGTLKHIIAHHTQVFSQWPLVLMIAAFDADQFDAIMNPAELTYYALTTRNTWGPLGWRRDQWGATDVYLDKILKNNEKTFGTSPQFREWITTRYLTSPVTGEPPNYVSSGGPCEYWDLERQFMDYGATSMGNGNFGVKNMSVCGKDNVRAAFKRAGYRIILDSGSITSNTTAGKPFSVSLNWKNIGIAPTYENWNVIFELKNDSGVIVWTGTSKFKPKLFAPNDTATNITDNYTLPANIPIGKYKLNIIIKDPAGYRAPFPLAIKGRNPDGSYTITEINTSPNNCTPPVATIKNTVACGGQTFNLVLDSATGTAPYNITINGVEYKNIAKGQTITAVNPPLQKIWNTSPVANSSEDAPVELGVKFKSSVPGLIKGIRFFSSASPSGIYKGHLWTSSGTLLDSVTFVNVTASGWQEALFSKPIPVLADTIYVASYHTSTGHYAATSGGLASSVNNGSLTALSSSTAGGNGVYSYGTSRIFPTNSFNAANYWVDVIFTPLVYTFNLTNITDSKGCSNSGNLQMLNIISTPTCDTTPVPVPDTTKPVTLPTAKIGHTAFCAGQSYNLVLDSATGPGPYDLVINGATYNNIAVGQTITKVNSNPQRIWDSIPSPNSYEDAPVELGLKFKSSKSGFIKGIRFFSPQNASGAYRGHLWTSGGSLIDSVVYTNVTASGWQEALFVKPLTIMADTIYIASYHSASGHYSATSGGLANSITNGFLTALGSGVAGGNGLYSYGLSPTFPTNSFNSTNYWVDIIFVTDTALTHTFNLTGVTDSTGAARIGNLQTLIVTSTNCNVVQARPGAKVNTIQQNNISSKTSTAFNNVKSRIGDRKVYLLGQNYPNPFHNETVIQYNVAEAGKVSLSLYDMNGKLIKILVNGSRESGTHTVRFNSASLSSGIYFYKMQSGNFSAVKKMIIQ